MMSTFSELTKDRNELVHKVWAPTLKAALELGVEGPWISEESVELLKCSFEDLFAGKTYDEVDADDAFEEGMRGLADYDRKKAKEDACAQYHEQQQEQEQEQPEAKAAKWEGKQRKAKNLQRELKEKTAQVAALEEELAQTRRGNQYMSLEEGLKEGKAQRRFMGVGVSVNVLHSDPY